MRDAKKDAAEMAERRGCLLEAGFSLFSARSIEAVKLTEIAEKAGLGIVTLYRYFKTKPALVIELGTKMWHEYYVEVEKAYAARNGSAVNAAEEMEFFIDSIGFSSTRFTPFFPSRESTPKGSSIHRRSTMTCSMTCLCSSAWSLIRL